MYLYEDLWIKISNNLHNEINPLISEVTPGFKENYWYSHKNINGKVSLIKNFLLSLNHSEISLSQLVKLKEVITNYKEKIELYWEDHNVATGFVYLHPEDLKSTQKYFSSLDEYLGFDIFTLSESFTCFFLPGDVIGFPADCFYKCSAKVKHGVKYKKQEEPLFSIEKEKGKLIGNGTRNRNEQNQIETEWSQNNPDLLRRGNELAWNEFVHFAIKTKHQNERMKKDFEIFIELIKKLIAQKGKAKKQYNLFEIEKIYAVLTNGFIRVSFEEFSAIFQPDYSGEKIEWLGNGAELKYFLNFVIAQVFNVNNINQWAADRFSINGKGNLYSYLGTVMSKHSFYRKLLESSETHNPIYKLSKEF